MKFWGDIYSINRVLSLSWIINLGPFYFPITHFTLFPHMCLVPPALYMSLLLVMISCLLEMSNVCCFGILKFQKGIDVIVLVHIYMCLPMSYSLRILCSSLTRHLKFQTAFTVPNVKLIANQGDIQT